MPSTPSPLRPVPARDTAGSAARPLTKIVIVGHVDHGKSTLIGRLLYETNSLPEAKVAELRTVSEKRGMPMEWSFLLDSFQAERDQAITIDTTQIRFRTRARDYVIIDAPGHTEFLKNMVSGAAEANAAVLVVDAAEGVKEQTRRHGYLLHLLGVNQVIVAINKLDLVGYRQDRFDTVRQEVIDYLAGLNVRPSAIVPISAREGEGLAAAPPSMPWYAGVALLDALDALHPESEVGGLPLRLPVQDVYKFDERRIIAGRIETGTVRVGDRLLFSPSNKSARIRSIETWPSDAPRREIAGPGSSIGITLDEPIFVERGEVASLTEHAPMLTSVFRAHLFWLGKRPMTLGGTYTAKIGTTRTPVTVQAIERIIDTDTLAPLHADSVGRNQIAEVILRARKVVALDPYADLPKTGRVAILDGYDTAGGGLISMDGYPDQRAQFTVRSTNIFEVDHRVSTAARAARHGHRGGVLWFTGLSGAGKSTVAMAVEQDLFRRGYHTYVLDGDNIRKGLNANLGFSPEDRAENIRRVGEVAALFADAGFVVITAFISPYRSDRERARMAAGERFHEVFVNADLATCEKRDPKGLYRRARAGEIQEFTGISAPYEIPEQPELIVDTGRGSVDACVEQVVDYVMRNFGIET